MAGPFALNEKPNLGRDLAPDDLLLVSDTAGGNVLRSLPAGSLRTGASAVVYAADYGVVADGVTHLDAGSISASDQTLNVAGANYGAGNIGQDILVVGAGAAGATLVTTIASINSATSVELTDAASTTVSNATVTYGADNATALMNMRAALAGPNKPHWTIHFPIGQINYSNNRWLYNIGRFTVRAAGAIFKPTYVGASSRLSSTLWLGSMLEDDVLNYSTSDHFLVPHLFNDAASSATSITLTTAGDAGAYSPGDRVFLYFHDQQFGGYPNNPRYFEWNEVVAANAGTGELTLVRPLRHNYFNAVFDIAGSTTIAATGKPRCLRLDRADFSYPRQAEIIGGIWRRNNSVPTSWGFFFLIGECVSVRNAVIEDIVAASDSITTIFRQCDMLQNLELDKQSREVTISDCRVAGSVTGATGVQTLLVEGCYISGVAQVSPRIFRSRGNYYKGIGTATDLGLLALAAPFGCESLHSEGDTFHPTARKLFIVNHQGIASLTVGSVSGGNITVADSSQTNKDHMSRIRPGALMWKDDYTKSGRVTRLSHDGSGNFVIEGLFDPAPSTAETWEYYGIQRMECSHPRQPEFPTFHYSDLSAVALSPMWEGKRRIARISNVGFLMSSGHILLVKGFIRSIKARITKAYTGATSGLLLRIENWPSFAGLIAMDATVLSECQARVDGIYKSNSADVVNQLGAGTVYPGLFMAVATGGGTTPTETDGRLPAFTIDIEMDPLG